MKVLAALCGALLVVLSRTAAALVPIVVVVRPANPEAAVTETLTRIQGELVAAGCDIVSIDARNVTTTPRQRGELVATALGALAAFEIVHDAEHANMEIWVADRLSGTTVVRRIDVHLESDSRQTSTIAVRAVELLRASLLERLVKAADQAPPAEHARPREAPVAAPPRIARLGLELGARVSEPTVGQTSDLLGLARIGYRLSSTFAARATFVGVGSSTRLDAASGSASLDQQLGTIGLTAGPSYGRWQPFVSLGMGVHHLDVEGTAALGYVGSHQGYWSVVTSAGLGVSLRFYDRFVASLESEATLLLPSPVIRFDGVDTARLGRPMLGASLTLGVWL